MAKAKEEKSRRYDRLYETLAEEAETCFSYPETEVIGSVDPTIVIIVLFRLIINRPVSRGCALAK
jgi:hypothetical protein